MLQQIRSDQVILISNHTDNQAGATCDSTNTPSVPGMKPATPWPLE